MYEIEGWGNDYGMMGAYEIEGAGPDEIFLMGAKARAARPAARAPSPAFRGQAAGVQATELTRGRVLTLGFDSVGTVAGGAQATINSQPQVVFRPDRVIVPNSIAPSFLINDIKIGKNSMFISATGVPAQAFSHDASGVGLKMDTAQVSQIIAITVTNITGVAARFIAALCGPAVE